MNVTVIPIVIGAFGKIAKGLKDWKNWKSEEESWPLIVKIDIILRRGTRGVIDIVVENEHGDPRSNPDQDCLHFT